MSFEYSVSHLFDQHLLRPLHQLPMPNGVEDHVWPSIYLLSCLVLLALVKSSAYSRVVRVVQSTFSQQIFQQLEREEVNSTKYYSLALNFFFMLNLAFFVYQINATHPYVFQNLEGSFQFLIFLAIITAFALLRVLIDHVLAFFTNERRLLGDYRTSVSLINQAFGLFLFLWLVLDEFTRENSAVFLWLGASVVIISVVMKWYRGMVMGLLEQRIGLLQIFSYFCGLEILPLLVVIKFLIETF